MTNTIYDLMVSHFTLLDGLDINLLRGRKQIDFLRFYVPVDKLQIYGSPRGDSSVRDNPNMEKTPYQNVYKMTDYKQSLWVYCLEGYSPVSVLRRSKVKVKKDGVYQECVEICIYGKALALYYSGHLSWLTEFVSKYQGECSRVDICYDFRNEINGDRLPGDIYTDLRNTALFPNKDNTGYDSIYYGDKHSPLFIRIYNKTEDLRKDKNIHAFIYPKRYMEKCWRVEFEIKGRYSKTATPLEWLTSLDRNFKINPIQSVRRNNFKTALYSLINCIDLINFSDGEKIIILQNVRELINQNLKRLYHNSK